MRSRKMTPTDVDRRASDARTLLEIGEALLAGTPDSSELKAAGLQAVHAGIAASDAICGRVLGFCSNGQDHREALSLLADATRSDHGASNNLGRLLDAKTTVDYSPDLVSAKRAADLVRYARRLVERMDATLRP